MGLRVKGVVLNLNLERVPGHRNVDRHVHAKLGAQECVGSGVGRNFMFGQCIGPSYC